MPLDILPPEVLGVIADFLPTGSVASLALCNKKIWAAIGTQSWKDLSNWWQCRRPDDAYRLRQDKVALLTSLQLGLTDLIYCHECEKFCHRDGHNPNNRSHPCIKATRILDLVYAQGNPEWGYPEKVFSLAFLNLQLLMSCYRSLCRESSQENQLSDPRLTELLNNLAMVAYLGVEGKGQCMTSAKVVDDELIIRMETRILVVGPEEWDNHIQMHLPRVCRHVRTWGEFFLQPPDIHYWLQGYWQKAPVHQGQCAFCRTRFLAEIKKEPESKKYLVEFSVWKNLGSFKSHDDEEWRRHLPHEKLVERDLDAEYFATGSATGW